MPSWLAELDRAQRDLSLRPGEETARALQLLEWPRVTAQIAAHCLTRRAAAALRERVPYADLAPIELRWRLSDELRAPGERGEWPPLLEISDVLDRLEGPRPLNFEGPDLLAVAAVATALDQFADHLRARPQERPLWAQEAVAQERFDALAGALQRALDREGRLRDDASPQLGRLRRAARQQEREARAAAQRALARARASDLAAGDEVVLRGERYCLPLRAGARRRFDGIVHDRSATGGTLFVEPAEVVELFNVLVETRLETSAEEARLLLALNRAVETRAAALVAAGQLLLLADETRAALLWSARRRANRPALAVGAALRLCAARHPLLEAAAESAGGEAAPVVPLDLELPAGRRALLISGPNAGGKSVALKTAGVCVLLAQCGWSVPAREDTRLPLVDRLCVDLGDEQSIEKSLSSFSAHLGHLARFVAGSGPATLVLCDEICAGTDPDEGAALAYATLEQLVARGATAIATTHFGLLKAAVHDNPGMLNAAMDFDEATLRPLFTLRQGVPGASHAFAIAQRCGLPAELLARARSRVGEARLAIEQLLGELGERARDLEARQAQAREAATAAAARAQELERRLAGIERERADLLERSRHEGETLLREGRRAIEGAVREIRQGAGEATVVEAARAQLRELARRLGEVAPEPPPPARPVPRPGDRVRIPHLNLHGVVLEVRGQRLVAESRGMRLALGVSDVEPLADGEQEAPAPAPPDAGWIGGGPHSQEIDLRGQRAEAAWEALDLLIDRAIPGGTTELLVVHGWGPGRLREALWERLAADPRVAEHAAAPPERGGAGATIVLLA